MSSRLLASVIILGCLIIETAASASTVTVRYQEGLTHGFLVLSTLDGTPIAEGDLSEVVHGDRVTSQLVYHFKDGSRQEETAVFSQSREFRLIRYHLDQEGPTFKQPTEISIEVATGQVQVKYTNDKGQEKETNEHLDLPEDLANGLVLTLLKNLGPEPKPIELPMVVATPKPRLVKLEISDRGKEPFTIAGAKREAMHFVIKVQLGGLAGVLAPLLGKEPPDAHVWIIGGEAPTFVKSETLSFPGGPLWRTELVSPVWPQKAEPDSKNGKTAQR